MSTLIYLPCGFDPSNRKRNKGDDRQRAKNVLVEDAGLSTEGVAQDTTSVMAYCEMTMPCQRKASFMKVSNT
jgi:hypothetical protein